MVAAIQKRKMLCKPEEVISSQYAGLFLNPFMLNQGLRKCYGHYGHGRTNSEAKSGHGQ